MNTHRTLTQTRSEEESNGARKDRR
eukprot:COSAG06_NODE_57164_length_281_cov_0.923077_1_plen_24_part_10